MFNSRRLASVEAKEGEPMTARENGARLGFVRLPLAQKTRMEIGGHLVRVRRECQWFARRCLIACTMATMAAAPLGAETFTGIAAFGDSWTDTGNVFSLLGLPPSPPYFSARLSNGPVWLERLADRRPDAG